MRNTTVRCLAAFTALALVASACGKDRDKTVETTAATATAVANSTAPATAPAAAATTVDTSTAETTPATTAVAAGPMFGDAPWPCGTGDGANTDDGTEVGVTKDAIQIGTGDDAGYAGSPGLSHQVTDAMKALVKKCNELGGINGRQIDLKYYDAALFNVGPAMQSACDEKNFFLVGEAWAFDSNQEEIRLGCGLPAVPTYTVSAAFAMGRDVFQGTPNPADQTPAGVFAMTAAALPDAVKKVGTLTAGFSATQETRDKVVEAAPAFGWGFSETTLEYNPVGESDWTPFVKQLQDAGSTAVSFSGTCLPNLQLFAQAAKANGLDVPIFGDSNFYEAQCAAANTDGALDNLYTRMAFIPFEEADVNPATKDYLDLIKANGGDVALLGAQTTSSFLLWATAASECGVTLTRACTLTNLKAIHSWTGHGLHAETDPGNNHPPSCNVLMRVHGTTYVRVAPEKKGTFQCDPSWIAPITKTAGLLAAKLDANRISQQFTGG